MHANPATKVTEQLRELERVAETLGIKVSYEAMAGLPSGAGGLCRLRGQYRLIIDRRLKPGDRAQMLADTLARFDTTKVEMSEMARVLLRPASA
jgi:hypothetical protein